MQDGWIKAACAAPKLRVADCAYNAVQSAAAFRQAVETGARLVVFPELSLTGYTCGDLFPQPALLEGALAALAALCRAMEGTDALAVAGLPFENGGKLYNCAAVLQSGRVLGLVPKRFLPGYGEFYEPRSFSPAPAENRTVSLFGREIPFGPHLLFCCQTMPAFRFAAEICEDLWTPAPPSVDHALAGATVIVNLSASDETVGKPARRRSLVAGQSARLLCGYLYADAGEGESTTDLVFSGHCMLAENGTVIAESLPFSGGMPVAELDLEQLLFERRRMTSFLCGEDARYLEVPFSLRLEETRLTRPAARLPFVPPEGPQREEHCEEILSIQAHGLAHRLRHSGAQTAVLGLSGGLDSTLALLAAARALRLIGRPASDILAVTMPCFGTTSRTRNNAVLLAEKMGASLKEVDITRSVLAHFEDLGHDPACYDATFENAQARERTQLLMDLANQCGGIVIGTGDLSELALGWATYNGDHMSMYGVNASVPKTLVRCLVRHEARRLAALAPVLEDILDTPVSPELLPPDKGEIAQKTEGTVGPYELHDFFLYHAIRQGCRPRKLLRLAEHAFGGGYRRKELLHWMRVFFRRFFSQQFKRSCLPDGPKVGSLSLSPRGDWRMPSDASAALWLAELDRLEEETADGR
ncbi:MAG: NAD(+) synthase [Provencibacterium sp.]|nr:NAD(+) synthase [Provencibacterium sp.]